MPQTHAIDGDAERRTITNRLRRLQGQVRGLASMIETRQGCEAVLTQIMAARSALGQVGLHIVGYSMKRCLAGEAESGDALVDRAFEVFLDYRSMAASSSGTALATPRDQDEMVQRLHDVEAGLLAVQADLEAGTACDRLVTRIGEVTAMLNEVALGVLSHSMRDCLIAPGDDRERVIDDAVAVFLKYSACLR